MPAARRASHRAPARRLPPAACRARLGNGGTFGAPGAGRRIGTMIPTSSDRMRQWKLRLL